MIATNKGKYEIFRSYGSLLLKKDVRLNLLHCVIFTFAFGLLTHAYCYLNPIFAHDALYTISAFHDNEWQIMLGRYAQPIYRMFRDPLTAPWLVGSVSLIWLSMVSFFTCSILDIRTLVFRILVCGLLTCNMTVTLLNASYLSWSDIFMLAAALSCAGVFLLKRFKFGFLGGAVCLAVSLALYQAYLAVAVGIILLLVIKMALKKSPLRKILILVLKGIAMGGLAALLYYLGLKISKLRKRAVGFFREINMEACVHYLLRVF